ncbi:hypothetical protein AKJ39_01300 [candidate division MSBL1 archaeon SCGC-AAA259J03]|uniref:Uncharacterized protein n=1 Tax=candidate division MSBL1 archaeon SCGC-AAA259J03 TaxID=1698269 RepID=A0A656YWT6_9EURY|nr:hypothetical protein AKJ39_01300 [candidate division MSBL1 archaeon SCGC-AAA259J03]
MRQTDYLPASFIPPVILLVVLFFLVAPVAVSAYQPQSGISGVNFDNASLDVHVLVKEDGYVAANVSFHMEKKVQGPSTSFTQFPLESGDFQVRAKQIGDNLVKLNADVQAILIEDELGTKVKFGLSYLSNMTVEDINEKYAPMVENLYSKLGG